MRIFILLFLLFSIIPPITTTATKICSRSDGWYDEKGNKYTTEQVKEMYDSQYLKEIASIEVRNSSRGSIYIDTKTGKEVSPEYVEASQRAYKQKQKDFALTAKMVCLPIAMGLLIMFFCVNKNDTISKAVFGTMLRYISILVSIGLLLLMGYVLVDEKGYKHWQWYVCTLVIIINLLALLRLDTGKSYLSTFIRRKQIENEMKTIEAEKKLDELRK